MRYKGLTDFLNAGTKTLGAGPLGMIFVEDLVEVDSTITHHLQAGFADLLVFCPDALSLPAPLEDQIHRIPFDLSRDGALQHAVNTLINQCAGRWMYYCYNAEYLFHPFCDTRSVQELVTFHSEERRDAILTYVVDLYADDLEAFPDAVAPDRAYLDKSGYYALARPGPDGHPLERQLDFFGGLRWRFEEHVPTKRRKIDRIALFRAKKGLVLRENHTFNDEEYNTYSCPWHNNITVAITSFRTAKALKSNAGSKFEISTFKWHNSVKFDWSPQQLMDLGLMEPGQWF